MKKDKSELIKIILLNNKKLFFGNVVCILRQKHMFYY